MSATQSLALPGRFVTTAWLQEHLENAALRVVQVGGEEFYPRLHIPGAHLMLYGEMVEERAGVPSMRREVADLARLFGRLGIDRETPVVAYDATGGLDAARFVWSLAMVGNDHGAVLDGGMMAWHHEARPLTHQIPTTAPVTFTPEFHAEWEADWEYVMEASQGKREAVILDTRSKREFLGMTIRNPRGHIPGAVHLDWVESLEDPKRPFLRGRGELMEMFGDVGIKDPEREVITLCHSAHRAAQTWLLLRELGIQQVRLYDGSMTEWGIKGLPMVFGG